MKIYLSVNNGADILTVPVIPPEFTVQKPQGGSAFETISSGELNLIGTPKLKSISWSSFFPIRGYSYLQDTSMKGFEYGYMDHPKAADPAYHIRDANQYGGQRREL